MLNLIILIFVLGYLAIALEHPIRLNKTATALLTSVLCWSVLAIFTTDIEGVVESLEEHLGEVSEIIFFLLGAMTIVELIDSHDGFQIITDRIRSRNIRSLLWVVSLLTFFLSALLDNLTTAIVMVSLLRKLIQEEERRKLFAGVVIIAANAGGAWSPLGDVTTTMLWIGGQITAGNIIAQLIIPSLVALLVPLLVLTFRLNGTLDKMEQPLAGSTVSPFERNALFFTGVGVLIFVPIFKTVTHLPPYMGMLLGLGVVWLVSEILHKDKDEAERQPLTAAHALSRIDVSSVLFFLGILLAIGALESVGILDQLAGWMDRTIGNQDLIVASFGLASAVIDNVPLVAAAMGMYELSVYPTDSKLWEFLAYCAGTGGSVLIIGSAAGVAVMGMEKIDFVWFLRKISLLALIGYVAGALTFLALYELTH